MPSSARKPSANNPNKDTSTPWAFYLFVGALVVAVLGFLGMLLQMTFL